MCNNLLLENSIIFFLNENLYHNLCLFSQPRRWMVGTGFSEITTHFWLDSTSISFWYVLYELSDVFIVPCEISITLYFMPYLYVVWLQAYRYCYAFCCSMISVSLINWICVLASASAQVTITIVVSNVFSFCLFQKLKSPCMLLCWFLWLWVLLYLLLDPSKPVFVFLSYFFFRGWLCDSSIT